jgi:hypothetical protein
MTASRSLPDRPSLESLRKQAKKLARDIAAGDAAAIARTRAHLPNVDLPLTQRNAQLVIAREYGFAGWQDLTAEVSNRLGKGLEWAVKQADRIIHDNDVEGLKQLLAEYPALLSWRADQKGRGVLGMATSAYAYDVGGNAQRERDFTRAACAELLIDAGAVVAPSVYENILQSRASGLLALFQRKDLLPRTLKFFAALGDVDAVRTALDESGDDPAAVNEAFVRACLFKHEAVAALLLERSIALDAELGETIDRGVGRAAFITCFVETRAGHVRKIAGDAATVGLWKTFAIEQVSRSVEGDDLTAFVSGLRREPWLLGDAWLDFQNELMGCGRAEFIAALLDLDPAILRRRPPRPSHNIEYALVDAKAHLIPLLTRIWPVPDDLPHAAGMGDLERVKRWFDADGTPALGDLTQHAPATSANRPWNEVGVQEVLDTALAWSVINRHFDVADFLLEHGTNINTNWNSHEPASILHCLVFLPNPYESMQFLIDRGIDMTIKDYRWNSNAVGWARYGNHDEKMAQWLEDAQRQREQQSR